MTADDHHETRQERRERKLKAKREYQPKHGAGLRQSFADSALKMAQRLVKRRTRKK